MEIKEITEKKLWEEYVEVGPFSSLLSSWNWGKFQETLGKKVCRYGIYRDEKLVALFYTIEQKIPFGLMYLYAPKSPLIIDHKEFDTVEYAQILLNLCKTSGAIYLKTDITDQEIPKIKSFKKVEPLQPEKTLVLDLSHSEDELLKSFHYKTRYNIRLAEKKGVKIRDGNSKEVKEFITLLSTTTQRDKFTAHSLKYYSSLLELDSNFAKLIVGEYNGKILCANIMTFYGDTVTYLHGASSNEDRNVMAPFLLQWECIKKAKQEGFKYYDFWGIDEQRWPGVTRFKRGFVNESNGLEIQYPGTYDVINKCLEYFLYRLYKSIRKIA